VSTSSSHEYFTSSHEYFTSPHEHSKWPAHAPITFQQFSFLPKNLPPPFLQLAVSSFPPQHLPPHRTHPLQEGEERALQSHQQQFGFGEEELVWEEQVAVRGDDF
jgi:hypothetical protein